VERFNGAGQNGEALGNHRNKLTHDRRNGLELVARDWTSSMALISLSIRHTPS
jgi:hypothetical protein